MNPTRAWLMPLWFWLWCVCLPARDITRFNTHALLVSDANREFSVYAYPFSDDWEIAYSDFSDAHDDLHPGTPN